MSARMNKEVSGEVYREEPVKPAVYTMLVAVAIVAVPLGWLNQKISAEGAQVADTSRYMELVKTVSRDVGDVQAMLRNETIDDRQLKSTQGPMVTLITPDIVPTNKGEAVVQESHRFKIDLEGIFWSPTDSYATINDETYKVGDSIQGFRIVEIRKTEVVFEKPSGGRVVKRFYEHLEKQNPK